MKPAWIASLGCWEDIATPFGRDEPRPPNQEYKNFAPPIGPFDTKEEAVAWVKQHSMALGNEEEHAANECGCGLPEGHVLPDELYAEYVMQLDHPDQIVTMHLGDEPGEVSPEVAADILSDQLKKMKENRDND